jgi:hypothetical protein
MTGGAPATGGISRPCGNPNRSPLDVVGRANDLINCYLESLKQGLEEIVPQIIIAVLLIAVMLFAAYIFLKGS